MHDVNRNRSENMRRIDYGSAPVRAYIVFSADTAIEDGVKAVESEVLGGGKLDVSRIDNSGHAVVARISGELVEGIQQLPVVSRIKIEMPARPTKN
ncbi:MAG: hypothetical protein K6C96_03975 [Butyrivibrio sp.]|nr:hypothetical protein [Butyrivibrio sp.]